MRRLLLALFLGTSAIAAQTSSAILGQGIVTEQRIGWGTSLSSSLYITGNKYLRDSASTRVVVDTSVASVGGAGACAQTVVIRTGSAVTPQLRAEVSYRVRATNASASAFYLYVGTRYRTPTGTDTGWVPAGRQWLWDSTLISLTRTAPSATTTFKTSLWSLYASGQDVRVCIARASSGGPGNSDTIVFNNNWLRAW